MINQLSKYYLFGKWKKTISGEFFHKAIWLEGQIQSLKEIEKEIKEEVNVKNQNKARFQDEEHLRQREEQQKELYEKTKLENSKYIADEEVNSKPRKTLNLQFDQEEEEDPQ